MWLYIDRKQRKMQEGSKALKKALCNKIDNKIRIYGYLLNQREYCGLQKIAWATFLPETPGLIDALEELESEGKISRKPDNRLSDLLHGGHWKANFNTKGVRRGRNI